MAKRLRILSLITLAAVACLLAAVSIVTPTQTYAADPAQTACNPDGSVVLTDIEPGSIRNSSPVTITVLGSGFEAGAAVVIQGYSTLNTTFVNANVLTAEVPAGIPVRSDGSAKDYDVLVYNPTSPETSCAILNDGLTVRAASPTATPAPTSTPAPTNFVRPSITVQSYGASSTTLSPGQNIDFEMTLQNLGQVGATNVSATFITGDLIPRVTGGTQVIPDLGAGESYRFFQPLRVDSSLWDYEAILQVKVSYTDQYGANYTETFDLSFPVSLPASTPTPTPTLSVRPDIVIESYRTEPDELTAGSTLLLTLDLANVSPLGARQVMLRLNLDGNDTLAALTSSNQRYIDAMAAGERTQVTYNLAVSGDASAGLVPLTFELSYIDDNNIEYSETESLSLRIDSQPLFYIYLFNDVPETINVGDTFELPIQIINIGQNSVNVNTIVVTSDGLDIADGTMFLGQLDDGTSGSLIAQATARQAGTATVQIDVNYIDEFQQPQVYTESMTFEVQDSSAAAPGQFVTGDATSQNVPQGFGLAEQQTMTVGERIKQAILGFFGLATRQNAAGGFPGGQFPTQTGE